MVLTLLAAVPTILLAQTAKALYCAENTTLYFVYDNVTYTAGSSYTPDGETDARTVTAVYTGFLNGRGLDNLWYEKRNEMTTADFQSSFAACRPTSTAYWFSTNTGTTALTTINHIENLNTSNVTNMESMFTSCQRLTSLDVTHFDTSNVTNMHNMFRFCSGLTELNVSSFDTSNVKIMYNMFGFCSGLTSLDLTNFKTSNVTAMQYMFNNCSGLTSLNVSSFNTGKVRNMNAMFQGCNGLKSLTFGENFATKSLLGSSTYYALNMFVGMNARFIDFSNSTYTNNVITEVNRSSGMFRNVPNTAVIYLPKDTPAPTSGDTQNVVYTKDGELVCEDYYSEDKVDIELPHDFKTKKAQYSRTMSRKYGTVILPYDFTSNDDIQCYTMTQEHTKTMYFVPTQTVPAHTPFLFEKKSSGDKASFIMEDANYGITVKATKDTETDGPYEVTYENIKAQEKVGSADGQTMTWKTRGYYVNQTVADYSNTYYIASDKFYLADGELTLYPHRATFVGSWNYELSGDDADAPFLNVGIIGADGEEQELTAIESAELFNTVNGISAIFDAQGRRLQQLQPGLNIVHMEDGTVRKVMGK